MSVPLDSDGLDAAMVRRLAEPAAYPCDPDADAGIETIQTHLSHVFLTRERVYKFRKPVKLSFVDFSRRDERNADCLREVRLNRRLAPDVYLGVAGLEPGADGVVVGAPQETLVDASVEHCVVMRRLPAGRDARSLLEAGRLQHAQLDRLATTVAAFHADHGLGRPAPFSRAEWLARCSDPARASFDAIAASELRVGDALSRARDAAEAFVHEHADRFEHRRVEGRAVDAHGDLHLQHVWFETDDAAPVVIDGLEFDEGLRHIDVAAEVAFTTMDLAYRGATAKGGFFLRRYARASGDFDLYRVVDFFLAYRAAVRAKVAAIAAGDREIGDAQRAEAAESCRRHVDFAADALAPRPPGALVLVGGIVGTGKSTVAEALAEALDAQPGAAVVASDRVRKQRAGLAPEARGGDASDRGLYAPGNVARTYAALRHHAQRICRSGRVAILDATWSSRRERERAWKLAAEIGARAFFVETRCAREVALERLAHRERTGRDPSDAGPDRYSVSAERFQPHAGSASDRSSIHRVVATDAPAWRAGIEALAAEIRHAQSGGSPP